MLIVLLVLIFMRPFICSIAFPYLNDAYSLGLLLFLSIWCMRRKVRRLQFEPFKKPVLLLLGALAVSTAFSTDKAASFFELHKYLAGLLLFFFAASIDNDARALAIETVTLAAALVGCLAIYQYFFGFSNLLEYLAQNHVTGSFVSDYIERRRVFFPFVTPNALAGYLIMTLPIFFYKPHIMRYAIIPLIALILTKSLGAFLSLFLSLALYVYLKKKLQRKYFIALCLLLALTAVAFYIRTKTTYDHAQPGFSVYMRLGYWENALSLIATHPLTGLGPGTFRIPGSLYAHNSYLQFLAEAGICGAAALLWLVILVIRINLNALTQEPGAKETSLFLMANAAFLIHNFVDFTFFLPEVVFVWWLLLGLSLPRNVGIEVSHKASQSP